MVLDDFLYPWDIQNNFHSFIHPKQFSFFKIQLTFVMYNIYEGPPLLCFIELKLDFVFEHSQPQLNIKDVES